MHCVIFNMSGRSPDRKEINMQNIMLCYVVLCFEGNIHLCVHVCIIEL